MTVCPKFEGSKIAEGRPSVAEAVLPLETNTYAIPPSQLKDMMNEDVPFVLLDVREE